MHSNSFDHSGAMMEPSKKPLNVLIKQLNGNIEVVLKNGCEYKEEQMLTNYGNVLLRGNNVLYIVLDVTRH